MNNPEVVKWRDGDKEHGYGEWHYDFTCSECGAELEQDQEECADCGEEIDWDFVSADDQDKYDEIRDRQFDNLTAAVYTEASAEEADNGL